MYSFLFAALYVFCVNLGGFYITYIFLCIILVRLTLNCVAFDIKDLDICAECLTSACVLDYKCYLCSCHHIFPTPCSFWLSSPTVLPWFLVSTPNHTPVNSKDHDICIVLYLHVPWIPGISSFPSHHIVEVVSHIVPIMLEGPNELIWSAAIIHIDCPFDRAWNLRGKHAWIHCAKKPVTTMLTYPWKCTVLHCNHLGNTWKPLVLMT